MANQGDLSAELTAALRLALPYVERIAAQQPTTYSRELRVLQARKDAQSIRDLLSLVPSHA